MGKFFQTRSKERKRTRWRDGYNTFICTKIVSRNAFGFLYFVPRLVVSTYNIIELYFLRKTIKFKYELCAPRR